MGQSVYERLEWEAREAGRLRHELRSTIHDASSEARALWVRLEQQLFEIERRMETVGRTAATGIVESLERLNRPIRALCADVRASRELPPVH